MNGYPIYDLLFLGCYVGRAYCDDGLILLSTAFIQGMSNTVLTPGTLRKNCSTVGKKPLKSNQNPYVSTTSPTIVQPMTTSSAPAIKNPEPRQFFRRVKNRKVACKPIVTARPHKKRRLPMPMRPRSKKKRTPSTQHSRPNAVMPIPIFRRSSNYIMVEPKWKGRGKSKQPPAAARELSFEPNRPSSSRTR